MQVALYADVRTAGVRLTCILPVQMAGCLNVVIFNPRSAEDRTGRSHAFSDICHLSGGEMHDSNFGSSQAIVCVATSF